MKSLFFTRLRELYTAMDNEWNRVAGKLGFKCNGCKDNCCTSLFFHHTRIEKAYLLHGVDNLDPGTQKEVRSKAGHYIRKTFAPGRQPASVKLLCPVNQEGRCLVYPYRPMICRLHGLPHELQRPGLFPLRGPGCQAGNFDEKESILLDRTPFYKEMAGIEMDFQKSSSPGRIKETVAQMIMNPR